jgi:hypothetical protein
MISCSERYYTESLHQLNRQRSSARQSNQIGARRLDASTAQTQRTSNRTAGRNTTPPLPSTAPSGRQTETAFQRKPSHANYRMQPAVEKKVHGYVQLYIMQRMPTKKTAECTHTGVREITQSGIRVSITA